MKRIDQAVQQDDFESLTHFCTIEDYPSEILASCITHKKMSLLLRLQSYCRNFPEPQLSLETWTPYHIFHLVKSGNIDMLRLAEQQNAPIDRDCLKLAIQYNHIELSLALLERFPYSTLSRSIQNMVMIAALIDVKTHPKGEILQAICNPLDVFLTNESFVYLLEFIANHIEPKKYKWWRNLLIKCNLPQSEKNLYKCLFEKQEETQEYLRYLTHITKELHDVLPIPTVLANIIDTYIPDE
jgi:hypothetical protein